MRRLPPWLRSSLRTDGHFTSVHALLGDLDLHTVCRSARCPNRHECWNRGTATVMILGDICTRNCTFCAVTSGTPRAPDPGEPRRVAEAAARMRLKHVVVTSVTRDDLPDGGAAHFAATVRALRERVPGASIEVLTPDFQGSKEALSVVLDAGPDVFNHNLETVRRLQAGVRPSASYDRSLAVLALAAADGRAQVVKSGLMLGMGETASEIREAMADLLTTGCRALTLGQYLAPTRAHPAPSRYLAPGEFESLAAEARGMGFRAVAAAPLVRSSYRAEDLLETCRSN